MTSDNTKAVDPEIAETAIADKGDDIRNGGRDLIQSINECAWSSQSWGICLDRF